MAEAEVRFEREERDGVIAVGTYLIDAAGRLGVEIEDECGRLGECDTCAVTVTEGGEFLSELTQAEIEQLSEKRRRAGERLSCQAKFEKPGEVFIMTAEKIEEEKPEVEEKTEEFRKEFEKMPLDEKVASLLELEAIAFGETVSFVLNSPYEVVGKVMDVMARFGRKIEKDSKKATRPKEHNENEEAEIPVKKTATKKKQEEATAKKKKTATRKAPTRKNPTIEDPIPAEKMDDADKE